MKTTSTLKTLMLGTALFGMSAFAQSEHVGGGGDIVTCKENGIENSYLLDVYEGKEKMPINLGGPTLTLEQKVALMASIYGNLDRVRAANYLKSAQEMLEDIRALEQNQTAPHKLVAWTEKGQKLKDIDDADELYEFPSNCKKEQLVRQDNSYVATSLYTIDQNLFNKLNDDQKAATIYHEVIYKDYRASGAKSSKDARYLNRRIFSQNIDNFSQKQYIDFLSRTHLKGGYLVAGRYEAMNGAAVEEFDQNGRITKLLAINSVYVYQVNKTNFALDTVFLKDDVFVGGMMSSISTFIETPEGDLKRDNGYKNILRGVSILVKNDEQYVVFLQRLNEDLQSIPGGITMVIDQKAHIVSKNETGYPITPVDSKMSEALNQLFTCLKPLSKKEKNKEVVLAFLENARAGIATQDPKNISKLTDECNSTGTTSHIGPISMESDAIYKKLSIKKLNTHTLSHCKGFNLSAAAGFFGGLKAGMTVNLVCTFNDGSNRVYAGLNAGIGILEMGASVSAGKVIFDNHGNENTPGIRIGEVGAVTQEISADFTPLYRNRNKHEDMYNSSDTMQDKGRSIGLRASAINLGFHALIRVGKRSDNFDHLVKEMVSKVIVPITPN